MNDSADLERNQSEAAHARRSSRKLLALLVGGGLAVALVLGGTIVWHRLHALPEVTQESFRDAQAQWETNGPASYNLRVELSGNWNDVFEVEVRRGAVEKFLYNGRTMHNRRTERVWTVPGMFSTLSEDLARSGRQQKAAEAPRESGAALAEPKLIVRARFDEQYGYPAEYLRIELGGETDASWVVTRFEVVEDAAPQVAPSAESDTSAR